jgi:hypothetical protein
MSIVPSDVLGIEWKPIATVPFDRNLELAFIDHDGVHALVFPCRRVPDGWFNAETKKLVDNIHPTALARVARSDGAGVSRGRFLLRLVKGRGGAQSR